MNKPEENSLAVSEANFLDFVVVLTKYSRMIVYTSVALTLLIYFFLFIGPNQYSATTSSLPPQQNMTMTSQLLDALGGGLLAAGGGGGLPGMGAGLLGLKSPADIYVGMLKGTTIADKIIARFNLKEVYGSENLELVRKSLSRNTKINVNKEGLIEVVVTDENPKRAEMANAYMDELDRLLQKLSVGEGKKQLAFLEKERVYASQNLIKAEDALRKFSEKNSVIQIEAQTKGMLEYIASLRAMIDSKEVQIKVLRQEATPLNYDFARMETELKGLKEKLQGAEKSLDVCVGDVCLPTSKMPALGLEYMRLYRERKFQESIYDLYTKMAEMARLDTIRDAAILQVVDYALPPEMRSNRRGLFALLGGMAGFLIMIFVALGIEYCQTLAHSEAEADRVQKLSDYTGLWRRDIRKISGFLRRS